MDEGQTRGLASFLECSICLHLFVDPKLLRCAHHFCRLCVAGIAKKRDDGTTLIKCPMRCKEETVLGKGRTIDDMSASYELKGILEKMQEKNKEAENKASIVKDKIRASMELMEQKNTFRQATENNIVLMETKLEKLLKMRKALCIAQYSDFLNKQEELLIYKLKTLSQLHLMQYEGVTVDKHEELLGKSDVDLLAEQENICVITNLKKENYLNISSLSISDCEFQSTCPLGDLELVDTEDKFSVMNDVVAPTLNDTFIIKQKLTDVTEVNNTSRKNDNQHRGFPERSSKEKKRKVDHDLLENPLCEDFDITQWVDNSPCSTLCPDSHLTKNALDGERSKSCGADDEVHVKVNPQHFSQPEPFDITQLI